MSADEHARAGRYHFPRDRDSYLLSRGLLRQLLAGYTNGHPAQLRFRYGAQGKPALEEDETSKSGLNFNVSHSGDMLLLGFAHREIGVDIERRQEDLDFVGLAKTSFSSQEQEALFALPPSERASLFYEYWSCKEACIKADGRGLSTPLDQFSIVDSGRGSQWRTVRAAAWVFKESWSIRILGGILGYAAAVATSGDDRDVVRIQLSATV